MCNRPTVKLKYDHNFKEIELAYFPNIVIQAGQSYLWNLVSTPIIKQR